MPGGPTRAASSEYCRMKDLSPDDRPREKLLRHGAAALGDNELVAIGTRQRTGERRGRSKSPTICSARGAACTAWRDARAAIWRRSPASARPRRPSSSPRWSLAGGRSRSRRRRASGWRRRAIRPRCCCRRSGRARSSTSAWCCSTRKHRVIRTTVVAIGTLNSTVVEPRDVFREAMLGAAAAVVVFHNHPSGDPSPSPDDIALTRRLAAVGELIGIPRRRPHRARRREVLQFEGDGRL